MDRKLAVIGLDCAEPELVFKQFQESLPNFRRIMDGGVYGKLLSTDPPITIPAWAAMTTGKDPGTLGFYGFRNRKKGSYEPFFATNMDVKEERIWETLTKHNKRSIIVGIPQTYPPKPLNGLLAASFLTPDKNSRYTYPNTFKHKLDKYAGGYIIDVENFRTDNKDELLKSIYKMTNRRFQAITTLAEKEEWDFMMFVEMGPDRIHHGFWNYTDQKHPLYKANNPYENSIRDYYVHLDSLIGKFLDTLSEDTAVMVVSDHGAKAMVGGIAINDWLIQKGYLVLKCEPKEVMPLELDMIDWENTTAWSSGGYCARVFLNVKGREPKGIVEPGEYKKVRDKLIDELKGICDKDGNNIGTKALSADEIYGKTKNIAPDIMVYLGDLDWRSVGSVGYDDFHVYENDTGPDGANHNYNGIYIYKDKLGLSGERKELSELKIYDVASTVLDFFGITPADDMLGNVRRG